MFSLNCVKNLIDLKMINCLQLRSVLPDSLVNLTNLQELWLAYNEIDSVPENIGNLKNLQKLMLRGTWISSLPESIGNLSNLTHLDLKKSYLADLSALPQNIADLPNLKYLWIKRSFWVTLQKEDEQQILFQRLKQRGCRIYM